MKKILDIFKANKIDIICVGVIFLIAMILRIVAIHNYGALTQDEPYSWRFAQYDSILEVIKQITNTDIHMPFYFVYLHIWINIFGDSYESLHYSSLFAFMPAIPLAFYVLKKLVNRTTAYFAISFLAFNTFCIYYSVFVRFYSLLIPFSILFFYFFIMMLEKFEKKYVIGFVILHCLLFYTFTLNTVLLFYAALAGLHYLVDKDKDVKKYLKIYALLALLSLPGVILIASNVMTTGSSICSHSEEFFFFDMRLVSDILENFFANENYQVLSKHISGFRDFNRLLANPPYFFLVAIPIAIGLFGFIKGLLSKNKNILLMAIPAILTIVTTVILARLDIMYYQTKYLIIIFPLIIFTMAYGFTLFKNKYVMYGVVALYMALNLGYTFTSDDNVMKFHNNDIEYMTSDFYYNGVKDTDIIVCPFVPNTIKYFYKIGQIVPFALDEAVLIKDKWSLEFYFGKENAKKVNADNVIDYLDSYARDGLPVADYEKNLYEQYISKMEKGQKLVLINAFEVTTGFCENPNIFYEKSMSTITNKFSRIMKKGIRDTIIIAEKYLKQVGFIRNPYQGYAIYIYEKE